MWREFEYLDPAKPFFTKDATFNEMYELLWAHPISFYYSPMGLFVIASTFYVSYVILFTMHLHTLRYPYHSFTTLEIVLWVYNAGYVLFECTEILFRGLNDYFTDKDNFWDVFISFNWIVLAIIRFFVAPNMNNYKHYIDKERSVIDEPATRDEPLTQLYIIFWIFQCILLWSRLVAILRRSRAVAPLVQMIFHMLYDILQFGVLLSIFIFSFLFSMYYAVGKDISVDPENGGKVQDLSSFLSVGLYIFQTLLGQQDWSLIQSDSRFGSGRSRIVETLMLIFSIIGSILLLNILIALMASTYDRVRQRSYLKVNYIYVSLTYEIAHKT